MTAKPLTTDERRALIKSISVQVNKTLTESPSYDITAGNLGLGKHLILVKPNAVIYSQNYDAWITFETLRADERGAMGWHIPGVHLEIPITSGTIYLVDCLLYTRMPEIAYETDDGNWYQGTIRVQNQHAIFTHYARTQGTLRLSFGVKHDPVGGDWTFKSCRVTPLQPATSP